MENAHAKSFEQIDELIKRDWAHMKWSKDEKSHMRKSLVGFVKAGKTNETRWTSCLTRVTKYWGVQHRDRFARLNYPRSSQTFYRKVITVVRLATTPLCRRIAV